MSFTLDELNALTQTLVIGQPTDIYFTSHPLLTKLMENKDTEDGGKFIDVPLEIGEANSGVYGATTKISTKKTETHNLAQFSWGGYHSSQTIDLWDKVKNNGKAAIVKLVMGKVENLRKTIKKKMATGIFLDDIVDGVRGFEGLDLLFNTSTSTAYGGITPAQYEKWAANVITDAITPNFSGFQSIRLPATVDTTTEGMPDLYLTTVAIKDSYTNSLQAQVRYQDDSLAKVGFANIMFDGAAVVADMGQTAKRVDALNTRLLQFISHSKYDFTEPVWEADKEQPDAMTANIRWIGQITNKNRAAHCRASNVAA